MTEPRRWTALLAGRSPAVPALVGAIGLAGLLAAGLAACAPRAVVLVSHGYDPAQVKRVALIGFTDYPGVPGSGEVAAGTFDKYLLLGDYQLVERKQVDALLKEQALQASGEVDPATIHKIGELLGVDALAFGTITDFTGPRDQTVMVDMPQEQSEPIYGQVETVQRHGDTTVRTTQQVVTGYNVQQYSQIVPQTETTPAHIGLSVRLVSVQTGEVLWSASGSASGSDLGSAAEDAAAAIMQAVTKRLAKR